jgi:hypothetical protein
MGKTSSSAWKRAESAAAAIFGARRAILSGSSNRPELDSSDSTHERLHIEFKLREKHTLFALWRKTQAAAKEENTDRDSEEKHCHGEVSVSTQVTCEGSWSVVGAQADDNLLEIEARCESGGIR